MDFIEGAGITAPAFPEGPGCSRGPGRVQAAGAGWVPDHTVDLHRRTRRWLGALLFLGLLGAVCGTAGAAETGAARWPTRAVKLVVPFVASGSSDIMARTVGQALAGLLGQPVVIENKPGAGGNIALEYVARQPGDGYTLLFGTIGTNGINPALYRHLPYDPVRDFAPVSLLHTLPNVLIVNPDLGVHSVPALIALARAHPGDLTFASAGNGSSSHLAGELFKAAAGIDIRHVPYKGGGAAIPDMIAGRIAMMFETIPTAMAPARSGKVVALAVTTPQRSAIAPELPTMAEAGTRTLSSVSRQCLDGRRAW
jgi:tripartite-type tricarboxylate transporter receptor subunit TctC